MQCNAARTHVIACEGTSWQQCGSGSTGMGWDGVTGGDADGAAQVQRSEGTIAAAACTTTTTLDTIHSLLTSTVDRDRTGDSQHCRASLSFPLHQRPVTPFAPPVSRHGDTWQWRLAHWRNSSHSTPSCALCTRSRPVATAGRARPSPTAARAATPPRCPPPCPHSFG